MKTSGFYLENPLNVSLHKTLPVRGFPTKKTKIQKQIR
jgi:hypothetical protein